MRLLIAGGGIGGLVAGLCLHRAGIEASVFESVEELRPLGVGINLLPHAVRVLDNLGLRARLEETAIATAELRYYSKFGCLIWSEPRGLAAGYRWPQYSIHRGRLQMILLEAARSSHGRGATPWSAPTASTRSCAASSTRTRARRATPAGCSGAA